MGKENLPEKQRLRAHVSLETCLQQIYLGPALVSFSPASHNRVANSDRNAFLTGFPFMSAIITIPQRYQVVNGTTAVDAGIRMLPLLLCSPIATVLASLLLSKLKLPPLYVLLAGCSLQTLGVGLFSSLDSSNLDVSPSQYGFQIIMGCGFGLNLSTVLMMVPLVVNQKDMGE